MALAQFSFTKPGSQQLTPEQRKFERDRQIAQMLQQQSLAPDQMQMAGGYVVPTGLTGGISRIAQALASKSVMDRADTAEREYTDRTRQDRQRLIAEALAAGAPQPALPAIPVPSEEAGGVGPGRPEIAAQGPDPMRAYMLLAGADDPMLSQVGMEGALRSMAAQQPKPPKWEKFEIPNPDGSKRVGYVDTNSPDPISTFREGGTMPVRQEMVNTGGQIRPVNPYQQQVALPVEVSPNTQATLEQRQRHWENLSPYQRQSLLNEQANIALRGQEVNLSGINTYFNTGMGPGGGGVSVPQIPQIGAQPPAGQRPLLPQQSGAPQQQQPMPQGASGPTPPSGQSGGRAPVLSRLTPKQQQELIAEQPRAEAALRSVDSSLGTVDRVISELLESPGFNNIFGPIAGRTPDVFGTSTNARALLESLGAMLSVRELQRMRDESKTGGAVGQVTEREWPRLEAQFGSLARIQTPAQAKKNLEEIQRTIKRMRDNAGRAYYQTYGIPASPDDGLPSMGNKEGVRQDGPVRYNDPRFSAPSAGRGVQTGAGQARTKVSY